MRFFAFPFFYSGPRQSERASERGEHGGSETREAEREAKQGRCSGRWVGVRSRSGAAQTDGCVRSRATADEAGRGLGGRGRRKEEGRPWPRRWTGGGSAGGITESKEVEGGEERTLTGWAGDEDGGRAYAEEERCDTRVEEVEEVGEREWRGRAEGGASRPGRRHERVKPRGCRSIGAVRSTLAEGHAAARRRVLRTEARPCRRRWGGGKLANHGGRLGA